MNSRNIGYWVATALIAFVFLSGGIVQLLRPSSAVQGITELGYPVYFLLILGVWKTLGGIAVLLPRFPLLKEWAYAGMFFDLTGATASNAFSGKSPFHIVMPLIIACILVASWGLRPASRKVAG